MILNANVFKDLPIKDKVIEILASALFPLLKLYWFIFRPHTNGVKVVLRKEGQILLVQHTYGPNCWTFPGGKQEQGETPLETARREVREELDVEIEELELIGEFVSREEYKHDHVSVCAGKIIGDAKPGSFEIKKASWFSTENLPEIGPVARLTFDTYEKQL